MPQIDVAPAPRVELPQIAVGSELTPGSDGGLTYVLALASRLGVEVLLLHVVQLLDHPLRVVADSSQSA